MLKRYFTLEEAQRVLNEIKDDVKKILEAKASLDLINSINVEYTEDYSGEFNELNLTKFNKEFHKLSYEFFSKIEEIEEKGCIIKDIDEGLIDFYSIINGKEIFLCWKYGEDKLEYWHDIEDGFLGRQHVDNLLAKKNKYFN